MGQCAALQSGPLVGLGKISYGIYLIHNLVYSQIPPRWDGIFLGLRGITAFGVTIILSAASYKYIENPIRGLKRFFPYP